MAQKRKPFITAKIHEEDEEEDDDYSSAAEVDQIDSNRRNKVLILNQNKCNRIVKFPCTIGEANELLMRQLVTVKFSFNSLPRKLNSGEPAKDYNGNYDVLPLICPEDLKVPRIDRFLPIMDQRSNASNISEDRQTMIEREMELSELTDENHNRIAKEDQFDKSVQILYQKFEHRSRNGHPVIGTMIVHQFITVAELSPAKGYLKLCQICHTPLRSYSTIKCVHCDFKCHSHCQNRVSTNWGL